MGHAIGTSGLVGIATVALVVMAILIIVADDRLRNVSTFDTNNDLKAAHNSLVSAQILTWISAGLALLLVFGYFILHWKLLEGEWVHLILWLGIFGTLIAAIILLSIALGDIDRSNVTDDNDAGGFTWAALGIGIGAFVFLLISGGWRIGYKMTTQKPKTGTKYYTKQKLPPPHMAEHPLQQHTVDVSVE